MTDPLLQEFKKSTAPPEEALLRAQNQVEARWAEGRDKPPRARLPLFLGGLAAASVSAAVLLAVMAPAQIPSYALDPLGPGILEVRSGSPAQALPVFDEDSTIRLVARPEADIPDAAATLRADLFATDPDAQVHRLEVDIPISTSGAVKIEKDAGAWLQTAGVWTLHLVVTRRGLPPTLNTWDREGRRLDTKLRFRPRALPEKTE